MFKDKFLKIKNSIAENSGGENNKKLIENLAFFVIILLVTVVIINYVWNKDNKKDNINNTNTKVLAEGNSQNNNEQSVANNSDIAAKLEEILSNIKGVGKVKVLVTYSQTSEILPMYSEDSSKKTTEETDNGGGKRTINEDTTKKDIVYEEKDGIKTPITQSVLNPIIEGAIITAQGATTADIKASIIQAVEAATGLATHKIQVFEMNN